MFARSSGFILLIVLLLGIQGAAQDNISTANRLFDEAETLRKTNNASARREAIAKFEAAIPIFSASGALERVATSLNNIGNTYLNLSEFEKALPALEQASTISSEINDKRLEIVARLNLGRAMRMLGRGTEAKARLDPALSLAQELGNKELEAAVLNGLGTIDYNAGDYSGALAIFEQAASIFSELGQTASLASLLNNIGMIQRMLGNQAEALELYLRAQQEFRTAKHKQGEADAALNLSSIYSDQFKTNEAIEQFNLALGIYREGGDRQRESVILNNVGAFFANIGDHQNALDYYTRSAELARSTGDRRQEASALKNIGGAQLSLNETETALATLSKALELSKELKDKINEAWVLNFIGMGHSDRGQLDLAGQYFTAALAIFRSAGNRNGEARVLMNLGTLQHSSNRFTEAHEHLLRALELNRELSVPGQEASTLLYLARTERALNRRQEAKANIGSAVDLLETLRDRVPGQHLKSSFASLAKDSYDLYIDLLMTSNNGKPAQESVIKAFEISERSRARSLLDLMTEAKVQISTGVDRDLLQRVAETAGRLNAKESARIALVRGKGNQKQIESLEKEISGLVQDLRLMEASIRSTSPGYAGLMRPVPLTISEVQRELLDEGTVLLEYSIGEDRSFLWAVRKNSINGYTLPGRKVLEAKVRAFRDHLTARPSETDGESQRGAAAPVKSSDRQFVQLAAELGRDLVGPVAELVQGSRVLVVADGALQYLPFAALIIPSMPDGAEGKGNRPRYFVETNELVYIPSASTLKLLRETDLKKQTTWSTQVAVLADPIFTADDPRVRIARKGQFQNVANLPIDEQMATSLPAKVRSGLARLRFSRTEAQSIASLAGKGREFIALDFAANIDVVKSETFKKARIVHFATHAMVNSNHPELSGVVLSLVDSGGRAREGFLRLHDIYNLRLDSGLVVLSACETALGKEVRGEGIVGLSRGFMYAGAKSVAASLWRVDDKATSDLMKVFYKGILKDGLQPSAALQSAQVSMIERKGSSHPFYWAGFTVQGDWRLRE